MEKKLIKIDRNGTKVYRVTRACGKCHGQGRISTYYFNEGGICFDCKGSGVEVVTEKEYTKEYAEKLQKRQEKRAIAKQVEERAKELADLNEKFPLGKVFKVLGETYSIKEQIKEDGGKFCMEFGWYFNKPMEQYETMEVSVDKCFHKREDGSLNLKSPIRIELPAKESKSAFVGEVGKKITVDLTLKRAYFFTNYYGYHPSEMTMFSFEDADGNEYVWNTSRSFECKQGDKLHVTATVKKHNEYKGVKQTVLSYLKVA